MNGIAPYLIDVDEKELTGPLAQFQATRAEREPTLKLMRSIDRAFGRLPDPHLEERFNNCWPSLEAKLKEVRSTAVSKRSRSNSDMFEEIVTVLRSLERRVDGLGERFKPSVPNPYISQPH